MEQPRIREPVAGSGSMARWQRRSAAAGSAPRARLVGSGVPAATTSAVAGSRGAGDSEREATDPAMKRIDLNASFIPCRRRW